VNPPPGPQAGASGFGGARSRDDRPKPPRKKKPPELAVVNQLGCTGCEVCIVFCPVDCIEIVPGSPHPDFEPLVEVEYERCIGCKLCARHCPWDAIDMLPYEDAMEVAPSYTRRSVCPGNPQPAPSRSATRIALC
jgi:Pyruvate/2-oxoacid:ferredoxin oxidoreductase delta subunit